MEQLLDEQLDSNGQLKHLVSALESGLILLNAQGKIIWIDKRTRRTINGGLRDLELTIKDSSRAGIDCSVCPIDVTINGERKTLSVLQETGDQKQPGQELIAAVEAAMSDTSWFTRSITERLKAWIQTGGTAAKASDLGFLTHREREILGLICEGRSDTEMSDMLGLSHNTVRNHVASLYRKIGVNRRSAAIIWARERGVTCKEAFTAITPKRSRHDPHAS